MAAPPPPPKGSGMSLYANLLNPSKQADAAASISGAPVLYDSQDKDDASRRDLNPSALRFQPIIRRPQTTQKKPTKPGFPKTIPPPPPAHTSSTTSPTATSAAVPAPGRSEQSGSNSTSAFAASQQPTTSAAAAAAAAANSQAQRSTLADWAAIEDDEYLWGTGEKRQRGGRKAAKKRKKQQGQQQRETDWDEIYDPSRPTNVDEYLRSDERIREVQEWKAVLYAHRRSSRRRRRSGGSYNDEESSEEEEEEEEEGDGDGVRGRMPLNNKFAPPAEYSFAPPPMSPPTAQRDSPTVAPDDATGDEAYARRMALSNMTHASAPPAQFPPRPITEAIPSPSPPPPPAAAAAPSPPSNPLQDGTTIFRGPVRYEVPPQPHSNHNTAMDIDNNDDDDDNDDDAIHFPPSLGLGAGTINDSPMTNANANADADATNQELRSSRPGQQGFAQRLMSKYGWTAGSGLGASSTGIINPLSVKVEKRKKRPDAQGGGFAEPGGRGKIIGGKTAGPSTSGSGPGTSTSSSSAAAAAAAEVQQQQGKFGPMSEVVVLRNMLEGMDNLQDEINDGLGQEIGEECGDKYGRVERLYIDVDGRQVFIKFTDAVSALRAVNALEGRVFNGNAIAARFWDAERFERGQYQD